MSFQTDGPPTWHVVDHGDWFQRFGYYGTGGLIDPKNYTVEPYLISGS